MSFYGDIKRINSSPYVFDRYYSSRVDMDANAATDGVYVGRYVFVKYNIGAGFQQIDFKKLKYVYEPNKFYIYNKETDSYTLCADGSSSQEKVYFKKDSATNSYEQVDFTEYEYTYVPNMFYTYDAETNEYALCADDNLIQNKTYFAQVSDTDKFVSASYVLATNVTEDNYKPNYYFYKDSNNMFCLSESYDNEISEYYVKTKVLSDVYNQNAKKDLNKYNDTFDGTVWQKIYTSATANRTPIEKYILIAELNAEVPRLEYACVNPKYLQDGKEYWRAPRIDPVATSEEAYVLQVPDTLHLDVPMSDEDFYGRSLIENPAQKALYSYKDSEGKDIYLTHEQALSPEYNYMKWQNYLDDTIVKDSDSDINTKKLETKLYAFGQIISDLYDALYGAPKGGGSGTRPFYTDDLANILSNYDKGLVGILTSIASESKGDLAQDLYGRTIQNGQYYYFITKWTDASENPENFIENIPEVIGAQAEGAANAHWYINYDKFELAHFK